MRRARCGSAAAVACLALLGHPAASDPTPAGAMPVGAAPVAAAPPAARDLTPPRAPVAERLAEIQRRVQAVARYPDTARARGVQGETRIGFRVGDDGRASGITLLASSGSAQLDRAAQRAVREAAALPPVIGRVAIPVRFELDPRSDRPGD